MSVELRQALRAVLAAELGRGYPRGLVPGVIAELRSSPTPVGPVELRSALSRARHDAARPRRGGGRAMTLGCGGLLDRDRHGWRVER